MGDGRDRRISSDRPLLVGSAAIATASTAVFTWMATLGRWDLFASRVFSNVLDLQARAIAHGRLSVPPGSLAFEGFVVDGRTYTYFGIFPSLLRLPILAVTDRFDGRLTTVSMLAAYLIALWSGVTLIRRVHRLLRPDGTWTRPGLVAALLTVTSLAVSSNLMFLASGAWVYHEASLWGAAGVLASFAAIVGHVLDPRPRHIATAGAWAAVAWLSRGSVGLGPTIALGALALDRVVDIAPVRLLVGRPTRRSGASSRGERGERDEGGAGAPSRRRPDWAGAGGLLAAALVGAVAFCLVNSAKFASPTALPIDKQVGSQHPWPGRTAALEAYGGSLFSLRLVPATTVQSVRPDLLAPTGVWPFVRFTRSPPLHLGQPVFDTVEPSAGISTTHPALLALAAVGGWASLRRLKPDEAGVGLGVLRPLLVGAAVGSLAPLTIAFIAQRYMTDFLPLLVVGAAAGVAVIDRSVRERGAADRRFGRIAVTGLAVLVLVGSATTLATTWLFQRMDIPPDEAARAAGIRTQVTVARSLGRPPPIYRGDRLPRRTKEGSILVLGRCDALYWEQTRGIRVAIESRAGGGHHRFLVHRSGPLGPSPRALVSVGAGTRASLFTLSEVGRDRARIDLRRAGGAVVEGSTFALHRGATVGLDLLIDPNIAYTEVLVRGRSVLAHPGPPPTGTVTAAPADTPAAPLAPPAGTLREVAIPVPTCEMLLRAHSSDALGKQLGRKGLG